MAISKTPISGRPISGDGEEAEVQAGKFLRQYRTTMRAPIIEDSLPEELQPGAGQEPEPNPCPTYDALPPDQKAVVDRLIVGARLVSMRGSA